MSTFDKNHAEEQPGWNSWVARILLYLLLAAVIFQFPRFPESGLDASWRMVLGRLFLDGTQFGHGAIFTYGPLGFVMGKTYFGPQFWSLIAGQAFLALTYPAVIMLAGRGLTGASRFFYFTYFVVLGVVYEDAVHMAVIAMIGFELLRLVAEDRTRYARRLLVLLVVIAAIKFTHLMLATFIVLVVATYAWKIGRNLHCRRVLLWYFGSFLAVWIICRQNPVWIPAYFYQSFQISQGYENAMSLPHKPGILALGVAVVSLLAAYSAIHFVLAKDKLRAFASALVLWSFLYLNWKHGFIRADGHVIGFFLCSLTPIFGFPWLLGDLAPFRWFNRLLLLPAGLCCILAIHSMFPPVIESAFTLTEDKLKSLVAKLSDWDALRASYDARLKGAKALINLPRTQKTVKKSTIDILGFDQSIILFNDLNYHPRPVFQSYSTYTPALDQLNRDFLISDNAPEYFLIKLEAIDERLAAMDDASILNILPHYYDYTLTERGLPLWHRKPKNQLPDPATLAPKPAGDKSLALGQTLNLADLANRNLWVTVDVQQTLLGRLHSFFYKPARVNMIVEDLDGRKSLYRLPTLIGQTGFILNPLIENTEDYTSYAAGHGGRQIRNVSFEIAPEDQAFLKNKIKVHLFTLPDISPLTLSALQVNQDRFWMFKTAPYDTSTPAASPSVVSIDNIPAIVMHAPSVMKFHIPEGATRATGEFGFIATAYQDGGQTDGAIYSITWTDGASSEVLFTRTMRPRERADDRGLKTFDFDLKGHTRGDLIFEVNPGPANSNAWDWTAWTQIEIK